MDPADVAEAAPVAGLSTTTTAAVSQDWTATRLVAPKSASEQPRPTMPLIGEPAPDLELRDQHGVTHTLGEHTGRRAVLLVFYPFAFSSVCTRELDAVRDDLSRFDAEDVAVLALSCDPVFTLRAFAERDDLTFPLLSDFWPHGEVARTYDVFDEVRGCARRSSFVVDRSGLVQWSVHNEMGDARDLEEPLRVLTGLAAG